MRLLERSATRKYFDEAEFVRLNPKAEQGYDLLFWVDSPELTAETDNEQIYLLLKNYIELTSGPDFRRFLL